MATATSNQTVIGRIRAALESQQGLPISVVRWDIETGEDASGHDAVWVWVVVETRPLARTWTDVIEQVRQTASQAAGHDNPWVYVRCRLVSE